MMNLWRLLRYGPGLYRAARKAGATRAYALRLAINPHGAAP